MKKKRKIGPFLEGIIFTVLVLSTMKLSFAFNFVQHLTIETPVDKYMVFSGIFLMIFFAVAIHELGHLIVGLAQGFRFELFIVGPIGVKRDSGRLGQCLQ